MKQCFSHNVVNVFWPERALTDDLCRDTLIPPFHPWLEKNKTKPRFFKKTKIGTLCVHFVLSVKWGAVRRMDHAIPQIIKHCPFFLHLPSSLLANRDSIQHHRQTDRQAGLRADRQIKRLGVCFMPSLHCEKAFLMDSAPLEPEYPSPCGSTHHCTCAL